MKDKNVNLSTNSTSIVLRDENEAQVGRLFYSHGNSETISINRLYVIPSYRKQGLGSYLINTLIKLYPNNPMLVNAFSDDEEYLTTERLIQFYNKFGFSYQKETEEGFLLKRN